MPNHPTASPTQFQRWIQAIRPFAFTASIIPVCVALSLAIFFRHPIQWGLLPVLLICYLLLHSATNLTNDYYDFINGVDTKASLGPSHVLVQGLLPPKSVKKMAIFLFSLAFGFGLIIVAYRGLVLLAIGIIGILGGYFYTAKPIGYKYKAWGDIMVFLLMGPLMLLTAYLSLTGIFCLPALLTSIPIGCLVTAILAANNTRDITSDLKKNIKTIANQLGITGAKIEYILLISLTYVSIVVLIVNHIIPLWTALTFLSIPLAFKNIQTIEKISPQNLAAVADLDIKTAKLHSLFGTLLALSLLISAIT